MLPRDRTRTDMHRHPAYYPLRNHIMDFLVTRSKTFAADMAADYDPRHPPVVRPGIPERPPRRAGCEGRPGPAAGQGDVLRPPYPFQTAFSRREETDETRRTHRKDPRRQARQGPTWKQIGAAIGGCSPILITAALLGQMKLTPPGRQGHGVFGLTECRGADADRSALSRLAAATPPTDPLIYRFYELVLVYGPTWKALIEEEFGDGIMSAIDFDMTIERQPDPKGDRVKITMSGKFLPYKYYD